MTVLVTGAAGFVGSHLCESLLDDGFEVRGVDSFTEYYGRERKEANLAGLRGRARFRLLEEDLATATLEPLVEDVDVVFHLAGQPGVRGSWGQDFTVYLQRNVLVTQRLLESLRDRPVHKFVYASSSSVYGDAESLPTSETVVPRPLSPYGVTKLAGEHLCELYRKGFAVPTASLRFFTVYGPRQRPDMAFARLVEAATSGQPFPLYGDGSQTRDFTYVADVVSALRRAADSAFTGVANVGGGSRVSMRDVLSIVGELCGRPVATVDMGPQRGDVRHTSADTSLARYGFGYVPRTSLRQGLGAMVEYSQQAVLEGAS
ncbi:MAG: galE1 [Frankiales bacterium]|jgi:nucleoside-diphosphate-sugar epimerase|nr:galE1 [Frankiales bacterium]